MDTNTPDDMKRKNEFPIKKLSLSDSEEEAKIVSKSNQNAANGEDEDEDDYSDSFEEVNQTSDTAQ